MHPYSTNNAFKWEAHGLGGHKYNAISLQQLIHLCCPSLLCTPEHHSTCGAPVSGYTLCAHRPVHTPNTPNNAGGCTVMIHCFGLFATPTQGDGWGDLLHISRMLPLTRRLLICYPQNIHAQHVGYIDRRS
jgi:hypothetical protein